MTRRRTWWLASAALALAVAVNWWLGQRSDGDLARAERPPVPFDYALTDFDAVLYDDEGRTTLRVSGPRLEHDPATRTALLLEPRFEVPSEDADWQGRAARGRLARTDDRLELEGDVQLSRPHPRGPVRIRSERLDYDRNEGTLRSPERVRVTQAGTELVGGTLVYRLNDDRVELQEHVHAIYRDVEPAVDPGLDRAGDNDTGPGPGQR